MMRWQERRRGATTVGGFSAAFLAAIAASAGAHTFDQPDRVLVDTAGSDSELVSTIDIGTSKAQQGTVVMSLPLERFGLDHGDRLNANSEVQVTTDCRDEAPRCVGKPYSYNPKVKAQLILAATPTATGGLGTTPISAPSSHRCHHKEHHCVLVFPGSAIDISPVGPPECVVAGDCYANLVVTAFSKKADPGNKLIIGEDEPDGTTVQDKGRLNAIRLRPLVPGPEPAGTVTRISTDKALVSEVRTRQRLAKSKVVVFSKKLRDLRMNDQLSVSAEMTADISHLPSDRVLVNSRLILASKRHSTHPSDLVRRVTEHSGELAEANGFNCTHARTPCLTRKVGVAHLIADPMKLDGSRVPLYVNLVVGSMAVTPEPGDGFKVTGGRLEVVRFPAGRYG